MTAVIPADVACRAVEWMVELQGEAVPAALRREWQRWHDSHPDHARAWQRIEAVNGRLRALDAPLPALRAALLSKRGSSARRDAVKALSVLVLTGGALWLADEQLPWMALPQLAGLRSLRASERTAVGVRRMVTLDDGSRVAINAGSAFDVHVDARQRLLALFEGEIVLTTAMAEQPFMVRTEQGMLRALGSRFAVRLHAASTQVSVFDGAVELRTQAGALLRTVQPGQQVFFGGGAATAPQGVDEDSVAWIDGLIVARGLRLDGFLQELNRYSTLALSCAQEVAGLRVSGSYRIDDVEHVLETLAAMLSLRLETRRRFFGRYRSGMRLAAR